MTATYAAYTTLPLPSAGRSPRTTPRACSSRSASVPTRSPAVAPATGSPTGDVDDPVGEGLGHDRVVAGDDEGGTGGLALEQDGGEQRPLVGVEALLGLVEQQH